MFVARVSSWILLASAAALLGCVADAPRGGEATASTESAATVCGQTMVKGVDVSHYDGTIDWPTVQASGVAFAFAKATESTDFTDPTFATNWAAMKAAGVARGAYHFFHADVDPTAQATYFLGVIGALGAGDLPPVLDLETTNGETEATVEANAATFLAAVTKATGKTAILYVSPDFLSDYSSLAPYTLWIANYTTGCPTVPAPWSTWTFWQNSSTGSVAGISGASSVDLDFFDGTLAQLAGTAGGGGGNDGGAGSDGGGGSGSGSSGGKVDAGSEAGDEGEGGIGTGGGTGSGGSGGSGANAGPADGGVASDDGGVASDDGGVSSSASGGGDAFGPGGNSSGCAMVTVASDRALPRGVLATTTAILFVATRRRRRGQVPVKRPARRSRND